jgi:hypothetical protein
MITAPPRTELKLQESHPARQIAERDNQDDKILASPAFGAFVPRPARLKMRAVIGNESPGSVAEPSQPYRRCEAGKFALTAAA